MLLKLWDQRDIYHSPLGTLSHKGAARAERRYIVEFVVDGLSLSHSLYTILIL